MKNVWTVFSKFHLYPSIHLLKAQLQHPRNRIPRFSTTTYRVATLAPFCSCFKNNIVTGSPTRNFLLPSLSPSLSLSLKKRRKKRKKKMEKTRRPQRTLGIWPPSLCTRGRERAMVGRGKQVEINRIIVGSVCEGRMARAADSYGIKASPATRWNANAGGVRFRVRGCERTFSTPGPARCSRASLLTFAGTCRFLPI